MFCSKCGAQNQDDSKQCASCGQPLGAVEAKKDVPLYFNSLVIIILLFFCFPIGIVLMWAGKKWNIIARLMVTAFFTWFTYLTFTAERPEKPATEGKETKVELEKQDAHDKPDAKNAKTQAAVVKKEKIGETSKKKDADVPPLSNGVVLTVEVDSSESPTVSGITNLPEGIGMLISIYSKLGYGGQEKVVVSNNSYKSVQFTNLKPGFYSVSVNSGIAAIHPEKIKKVIGNAGENLKGKAVKTSDIGKYVEVESKFRIGSEVEARNYEQSEIAKMWDTYKKLKALIDKGVGMQSLRSSESLQSATRCGQQMRTLQAEVEPIQQGTEDLPLQIRIHLGAAAIRAGMCITCSRDALQDCTMAKEDLANAAKVLKSMK